MNKVILISALIGIILGLYIQLNTSHPVGGTSYCQTLGQTTGETNGYVNSNYGLPFVFAHFNSTVGEDCNRILGSGFIAVINRVQINYPLLFIDFTITSLLAFIFISPLIYFINSDFSKRFYKKWILLNVAAFIWSWLSIGVIFGIGFGLGPHGFSDYLWMFTLGIPAYILIWIVSLLNLIPIFGGILSITSLISSWLIAFYILQIIYFVFDKIFNRGKK